MASQHEGCFLHPGLPCHLFKQGLLRAERIADKYNAILVADRFG
jgi:hypothetical protein